MQTFTNYSDAKSVAERIVREMANGSPAAALNVTQSRDALAAFERLQSFFQTNGRRVSLLAAVSEFVEASGKLGGRTLSEAVEGYLRTVATVKRKDIAAAVEEFIQTNEPRTRAASGQRAQLSAKYFYNLSIQLRRFADAFPNTALCDLTKEHLDAFANSLEDFSAKSRNHHRTAVRQFLQWAVRKDYLPVTHRLGETDGLRPERANTAEVGFYTPRELAGLLANASDELRPLIAVGGLAGLRALNGKSGVYVIREPGFFGEVLYCGESHTGRLYATLLRHFQHWTGKTAGATFAASKVEVAVVRCPANRALDLQNAMIAEYRPKLNVAEKPRGFWKTLLGG